jgi:chromosome segregation protein
MRIKKLEIHGFKSFAERAVLNFGHGITGVVGPNGCGKSNIVDALRWCMGEMSAKHLRGRAMQDVIFAGSDSRGPLGMAEVTITFNNDGNVPPQYASFSEIAVTRRLHRDGTSEYLVNKVPARLRDITDLFLGTGVGTRAYSIIEQGRIGFIVSSKPEDRRSLIEEVAGITKFKARKKAAERRMESTQQNLDRVGDVVSELERQLQSLRRQARRAEKYKELRAELRDLELHQATLELLRVAALEKHSQSEAEQLSRDTENTQAGIAARETSIESDRLRLLEIERELQREQAVSAEVDAKLAALERDLSHWQRQREEALARVHGARRDVEDAELRLSQAQNEHDNHDQTLGHLSASVDSDRERTFALESAVGEMQAQIGSLDREAEALRRSAVEHIHEGARQRTLIAAIAKRDVELRQRLSQSSAELEDVARRREDAEIKTRELTERRDLLAAQISEWRGRVAENRATLETAIRQVTESETRLRKLRDNLAERRSRLESLQEIARRFEGYSDGVRSLMQPEGGAEAFAGIRALITDVLEVPPELERAVEAALGERLQYVVVDAQSVGVTAIAHLQEMAGGRSGFVPMAPRAVLTGGRGDALTRVKARAGFEKVAEYLLADVSIAESLDAALMAFSEDQLPRRYVTLNGEVLDAAGTLIGGSEEGTGLLAKRREIRELEETVAALELEHDDARVAHQALETTRLQLEVDIQQLEKDLHAADLERIETSKDLEAAVADAQRAGDRAEIVEIERAQASDELEKSASETRAAEEAAARAEEEQRNIDVRAKELTERRSGMAEELAARADELTRAKVEGATRAEKLTGTKAAAQRLQQAISELRQRIERGSAAIRHNEQAGEELAQRIEEGQQLAMSTSADALRRREELAAARDRYEADRQSIAVVEQAIREQRKSGDVAMERLTAVRMELQRLELERARVIDHIFERHDVRIEQVITDYHLRPLPGPETRQKASDLDRQIKALGPINLTAIDECAEIETRYGFLVTQRDDLSNALESLKRAIQRINRASRERFQEAFDAVNEMFQQVYPRLFRGGVARLELLQSEDLLESGVEIIAQPPGKKLQNVSLLSGGEKALTATALVFAIFLIKPSPFCVLDEVDAPLDEANVGRFNEMLREISKISQFIVITHNKNTMSQADRLYGVTMQEPGMSTLVSVNLDEKSVEAA